MDWIGLLKVLMPIVEKVVNNAVAPKSHGLVAASDDSAAADEIAGRLRHALAEIEKAK